MIFGIERQETFGIDQRHSAEKVVTVKRSVCWLTRGGINLVLSSSSLQWIGLIGQGQDIRCVCRGLGGVCLAVFFDLHLGFSRVWFLSRSRLELQFYGNTTLHTADVGPQKSKVCFYEGITFSCRSWLGVQQLSHPGPHAFIPGLEELSTF